MTVPSSLLTILPIVWLLLGLAVLRLRANIVCPLGLALSALLAYFFWDFPPLYLWEATLDGAVFAMFPILWIVIAAFFMYNLSVHIGADKPMKALLAGISPDARIQVLIIAWGFGSFMEAVAGFGTAVVIPAAILLSLGFSPLLAATVSLLSNTIAVAFGVIGIPMQTLAWVTDLNIQALSIATIAQLGLLTLAVPFCIVLCVTKSLRGVKEVWLPTLASGLAFAATQYAVVILIGPELAAVAASIISIITVALCCRLRPPASVWQVNTEHLSDTAEPIPPISAYTLREHSVGWTSYIVLFILVILSSKLVPPLHEFLTIYESTLALYTGPGGKPITINWLTTPGTLLLSAALAVAIQTRTSFTTIVRIYKNTLCTLVPSCVTIMSIVCMAKVLTYSGMMMELSSSLASLAGGSYPIIAPFIGAIGSFITGSDTSANILFGDLQKQIALALSIDPVWIAASNTSGACIGKLISPQNITLAAVATGLRGQEGRLLATGLAYTLPFILFLGGFVYIFV